MTREELIEFFDKNILRYENLSNETMSYIYGENDILPEELKKTHKHFYITYFKEIVQELQTDNHELAKRMLYVISRIKRDDLCYVYTMKESDVKFLLEIGYDFQSILEESLLKTVNWFSVNKAYDMILYLFNNNKEDIEKYAENLLSEDLDKFTNMSTTGFIDGSKKFLTELTCVAVLLNYDKEKYKKYIEILAEYFNKAKLIRELVIILYKCYNNDKRLEEILKGNILSDIDISVTLNYYCAQGRKFLEFLKLLNIDTYPYYSLIVTDHNYAESENKNKILDKLFNEDKETFYKTYEFVKKAKGREYNSLYMLAVMLKNNEGHEILNKDKERFVHYARKLGKRTNEKENLFELIQNNEAKAKNYILKMNDTVNRYSTPFFNGPYADMIKIFSVLYDYDEASHKFIDFFIKTLMTEKNIRVICVVINHFLSIRNEYLNIRIDDEIKNIIGRYIEVEDIFAFLCISRNDFYLSKTVFTHEMVCEFTKNNKEKALKFFNDKCIKNDIDRTLVWLEQVYYYADIDEYDEVIGFLNNKSKKIRTFCEKLISENEENFREKLENMMPKLKGDSLKLVKRVIKNWDNERKYGKDFEFKSNKEVIEFVYENYDSDNDKLLKWIDDSNFENVRFINNDEIAPGKVIKFIFNEYMALTEVYRIKSCDKIIDKLNINDFRGVLKNIYDMWLNDGSDTKKKNIAIPYCIYSSDSEIIKLKNQLETWAKASRGAVAAYIVNAIALNGGQVPLLMIESISNKFPNAMVKKAAKKAFAYAANVLNIPEDELCDKIVPNLGFDRCGEKVIDYGDRTFKITLNDDFTLSIYDNEKNKSIKSLPKPNEKDDKFKAESAKKEFTELKKQIKAVIKNQTERLETVFRNKRTWNNGAWNNLFVENPIMHIFACKLIWGIFDEGKLIKSFRYMEDGTFNTVDEEEYNIPDNSKISLVHPCELNQDEIEKWKMQLEDYEIVQPFDQINCEVAYLNEEDLDGKIITKYTKYKSKVSSLLKIFKEYNLIRGEVLDAGSFTCYHYVDKYLKIGVQINFDGMYVGVNDYDEEIPLENVIFYKVEDDDLENLSDEIKDNAILDPRKIEKRFVCSIISILNSLIKDEENLA